MCFSVEKVCMVIMFFKNVCLYITLTSPSLRKSSVPIKEPHSYYIYCNTLTSDSFTDGQFCGHGVQLDCADITLYMSSGSLWSKLYLVCRT